MYGVILLLLFWTGMRKGTEQPPSSQEAIKEHSFKVHVPIGLDYVIRTRTRDKTQYRLMKCSECGPGMGKWKRKVMCVHWEVLLAM